MKLFPPKVPWYISGLAFECTECGACCAGPEEGYVWLTEQEILAIARHFGLTENEMLHKYVRRVGRRFSLVESPGSCDCIFLTTTNDGKRRCRIYDLRPRQCRTWPFWRSNLASPNAWALAGTRCPGINRGSLYTQEQIDARADSTRE